MAVITAIAAAGVAAGGAALAAKKKRDAEHKALNAQREGIQKTETADPQKLATSASDQDRKRYLDSLNFFRENDPGLAQARDAGIAALNKSLTTGQENSQAAVDKLFSENLNADPRSVALKSALLDSAQKNLALGATLPPEFQAELVRSGLEDTGQAGVGTARGGPLAQLLGTRLGSAGLALEAQRQQQAEQIMSAADQATAQRASILSGLLGANQNLNISNAQLGGTATQLANSQIPSIGLGGNDIVNLDLLAQAQRNKKVAALANNTAANRLSAGAATQGYIGAGTQFLTSALGGMGGGAGGGAGGLNFGALFGSGTGGQGQNDYMKYFSQNGAGGSGYQTGLPNY